MMSSGWRENRIGRIPRNRYGAWRRSFFVSSLECQALVLRCQALEADDRVFQTVVKEVWRALRRLAAGGR